MPKKELKNRLILHPTQHHAQHPAQNSPKPSPELNNNSFEKSNWESETFNRNCNHPQIPAKLFVVLGIKKKSRKTIKTHLKYVWIYQITLVLPPTPLSKNPAILVRQSWFFKIDFIPIGPIRPIEKWLLES